MYLQRSSPSIWIRGNKQRFDGRKHSGVLRNLYIIVDLKGYSVSFIRGENMFTLARTLDIGIFFYQRFLKDLAKILKRQEHLY